MCYDQLGWSLFFDYYTVISEVTLMAYQAIYRKWRPQVFEDIIGQSHITGTLKNQIMNDKVSHAYLFCGTRGTGKTTAAKVLSKAVNCLNPVNGSPCNQCEICKGIADGSIMDVTEIDAASNNSVDNIRDLRDDVNYVSTRTKYRVYIIDEVHMLSTGAFNALLKTLEEPPAHVIFILATTEVHKIPETILSRCQRFDFKRISPNDIIVRMKEIATADGISISEDAYETLAKMADGSMRDGLSILERCVSACGNQINNDSIISVLGIAQTDFLFDLSNAIIASDSQKAITIVDSAVREGKDLNVAFDSLIKHFRDLLVCKIMQEPAACVDYSHDLLVKLKSQAERTTYEKLSHATSVLTKAKADAKWVKNPRTIYELALIKITRPELDSSEEALMHRLSEVEEKTKNPIVVTQTQEVKEEQAEPVKKKIEPSARLFSPIDVATLNASSPLVVTARSWERIASSICDKYPFLCGIILNRKITIDAEGILILFTKDEVTLKKLASNYSKTIQEAFTKISKTDFVIKIASLEDVEDVMIDFWSIKADNSKQTESVSSSSDPLDKLGENFSGIVEYKDDDKGEIDPVADLAEQQELFNTDSEEFLSDDELTSDEEID